MTVCTVPVKVITVLLCCGNYARRSTAYGLNVAFKSHHKLSFKTPYHNLLQ